MACPYHTDRFSLFLFQSQQNFLQKRCLSSVWSNFARSCRDDELEMVLMHVEEVTFPACKTAVCGVTCCHGYNSYCVVLIYSCLHSGALMQMHWCMHGSPVSKLEEVITEVSNTPRDGERPERTARLSDLTGLSLQNGRVLSSVWATLPSNGQQRRGCFQRC